MMLYDYSLGVILPFIYWGLTSPNSDWMGPAGTILWVPGLVNVHKKRWKDPPCYSWVNPLFLWSFSIAKSNKLPGRVKSLRLSGLRRGKR